MKTKKNVFLLLCGAILMVSLACNFPSIAPSGETVIETEPGPGETLPDALPDPEGVPIETQPPQNEILPSPGLPTFTLAGGSGYLFSTAQNSIPGETYDIWWNNAEVVALNNHSYIVSLGVLGNLSEVVEINTQDMTPGALVPTPGEGFAFKIEKGEGFEYALVRMLRLEEPNFIVLEYVYPYQGVVIDNP